MKCTIPKFSYVTRALNWHCLREFQVLNSWSNKCVTTLMSLKMISGRDWTVKMLFFILLIHRRWSGTWTTRTHWFHWSRIWITRRFRWWWQLSCRYPIHPTSVSETLTTKEITLTMRIWKRRKLGPPVITNKRPKLYFKMHLVLQMTGRDTCKCVHSLYGMDITADSQLTLAAWYHSSPYTHY